MLNSCGRSTSRQASNVTGQNHAHKRKPDKSRKDNLCHHFGTPVGGTISGDVTSVPVFFFTGDKTKLELGPPAPPACGQHAQNCTCARYRAKLPRNCPMRRGRLWTTQGLNVANTRKLQRTETHRNVRSGSRGRRFLNAWE